MAHQTGLSSGEPEPRTSTDWRKATASDANSGCVEVAFLAEDQVGVRDSRDRGKAPLTFTAHAWASFLAGAKAGEFDLSS